MGVYEVSERDMRENDKNIPSFETEEQHLNLTIALGCGKSNVGDKSGVLGPLAPADKGPPLPMPIGPVDREQASDAANQSSAVNPRRLKETQFINMVTIWS